MRRHLIHLLGVAAALGVTPFGPNVGVAQERIITIFAAASLKNAIDDANAVFARQTGIRVVVSYAATPALVKQIEQGAPADVFLSADLQWMDYAAGKKLIQADTRVNLLGNKLVLIAAKDSKLDNMVIAQGFDIARLAGNGRIAVADVKAVPAGRYAKTALESLDAWSAAEGKLAQAENVRAALAFVSRGEAPIGIVYATDAKIEPGVKIIGTFPDGSHPPVTYPVAATVNAKPEAARYLDVLRTPTVRSIFETHGFSFLVRPTS